MQGHEIKQNAMTGNRRASLVSLQVHWEKMQGELGQISQYSLQLNKVQLHVGFIKYNYNHHRKLNSRKESE